MELLNSRQLEDSVCSPEDAKKLRELHVPQVSIFSWIPNELPEEVRIKRGLKTHYLILSNQQVAGTLEPITLQDGMNEGSLQRTFSAFTLQELVKIIYENYNNSLDLYSWIKYTINGGHSFLSAAYDVNFIAKIFIKHLEEKEALERKEFLEKYFKENPPYIPGQDLDKLELVPMRKEKGERAWLDFKFKK